MERDYWRLREVETRYRLVFDASNEAVVIVSAANLRVVEANSAAVQAFNSPQRRNEDLTGREFLLEVASQDREAVREMLQRVRERGKALSILVHIGPDALPFMLRGALMSSQPGQVFLLQLTPAAVAPAEALRGGPSTVEELIDRVPDGFVALDPAGVIRHVNEAFLDLVEVGTKATVIGESLGRWMSQPGADLTALLANVQRHKTVRLFATTIRGELGSETEIEISAVESVGADQTSIGVLLRNVGRRLSGGNDGGDLLWNSLAPISKQLGRSSLRKLVKNTVSIVEQYYVKEALDLSRGNRTATAELLGLSRQSLYAKLSRYGLEDRATESQVSPED
jgi:transcriptional regulator PpsR